MSKKVKNSFKDKRTKEIFTYIPQESMRQKYGSKEYTIVGEFCVNKVEETGKEIDIESAGTQKIVIQKNGYYGSQYITLGFMPTSEKNEVIAVKKKKIVMLPYLLSLLILLVCVGGWFLYQNNQGPDLDPAIKDYVSDLKRPADLDETQIALPGFGTWKMAANTDVLEATLFNPEGNPCYFKYRLIMEDSNELIFETKAIPPGKGITNLQLNRKLKAGIYEIRVEIATFDLSNYEQELNGGEMKLTLEVIE